MESLAELHLIVDQPREVVKYYARLGKPETFEFVRRFRLFDVVKDDVVRFLELKVPTDDEGDGEQGEEPNSEALALLVDHSHTIVPDTVLQQLTTKRYFQYCYIRALRERDGGFLEDYGDLQVELYAAFNRTELLHFLKTSNTYNLEKVPPPNTKGVVNIRRGGSVRKRIIRKSWCLYFHGWETINVR